MKNRQNITKFILISIINIALLVLIWTLLTPAQKQSPSSTSSAASLGDISSPLIGKPAPNFTLSTLNNAANGQASTIALTSYRGKPIILNFWASWCSPCNDEATFLHKAWPGLKAQGIVLIGIDGAENVSNARKFIQKYALTYPNVQDTITSAAASDYGVINFPETIFINRQGIVTAKWISILNQQGLQHDIASLIR